jgi:Tfp pilus assembly protein PilO
MEMFSNILIILMLIGFLFFLVKPKKQPKSKEQKQEEIRLSYHQKLNAELLHIKNPDERQQKKIALLKVFAKELQFNLFFDKEEVKILIQELSNT